MPISNAAVHRKVAAGQVDFTVHAVFEAAEDLVFVDEIEQALAAGQIIADDATRCRCVVCGAAPGGGWLHIVIEYVDWLAEPEANLVVVTIYRPDPNRWIDGRIRKP